MTDLQERNKKILTRCGVGAEKQDKGEIILDSRSSGFGSFTGFQDEFYFEKPCSLFLDFNKESQISGFLFSITT